MSNLYEDFKYQKSFLENLRHAEASARLSSFMNWLKSQERINSIIAEIAESVDVNKIMENTKLYNPPNAGTPKEIVAVGLFFLSECVKGKDLFSLASQYHIEPPFTTNNAQDYIDEAMQRYINPAIDYIERKLENKSDNSNLPLIYEDTGYPWFPPEITESLIKFRADYPNSENTAFVMMRFSKTKAHEGITESIRNTLDKFKIFALRADDKEYHDDLFGNVLTYLHACKFGIAVFERLEENDFNPNVSFEVGYMRALNKSICLLKDKTLKTFPTDLVGKLYKTFDPQDPLNTIPEQLEKWLRDKDIVTI